MKPWRLSGFLFLLAFLFLFSHALSSPSAEGDGKVREPVCADDRWYPRSAAALSELAKGYLSRAEAEPVRGELIGLIAPLSSGECEACGGGPTVAAMLASKGLGANRASILHYADSGDATGDRREVVGYLSTLFLKD